MCLWVDFINCVSLMIDVWNWKLWCTFTTLLLKSALPFTVDWRCMDMLWFYHLDLWVKPYLIYLHLCSHTCIHQREHQRISIKIRLFTYTATLTKTTWLSHFAALYFRSLKDSAYKLISVFDTTTVVWYVFISSAKCDPILWTKSLKTGTILNKK